MSSQAERAKSAVVFREFRALLLVLAVVAAVGMAERAEAAGTAKQLIVFTDKKVYEEDAFDMDALNSWGGTTINLYVKAYAVVLDDDGNVMRSISGTSLTGTLKDTQLLDHWNGTAAAASVHHVFPSTYSQGSFYNLNIGGVTSYPFKDDGVAPDLKAGDGIFTAGIDVAELPSTGTEAGAWSTSGLSEEHLNITVNVSYSTLNTKYNVLFTRISCMHGAKTLTKSTGHGTHGSTSESGQSNCILCHHGYEHELGVHKEKISPYLGFTGKSKNAIYYYWNTSTSEEFGGGNQGTGYATATTPAETLAPGSEYCVTCHYQTGTGALDLDSTTDRPSCGWSASPLGKACHASTKDGTSLSGIDWFWKQTGASGSKTHNHTTSRPANISCDICHLNFHSNKLPNASYTSFNINDQCVLCHNITGGLNITANGGKNVLHDSPDCKTCHMDSALKLDAHLVPTAGIPNANCTECHDLGGKAPYHIDFNTFNKTDFVHYNVTKHPLNHNASNGSAVRASENKICWGCHGDDPNDDGKANFSEQPNSTHPSRYKNARTCEECHQNESAPWDAPQNVAHSNNTQEVRTPGAPHCYDCHGQPVMFNNSQLDPDYNNSWKATLANHYGTGYPALAATRGYNGYCIQFCHQNTSSPFELEFANPENMMRPNHSSMTNRLANQSCKDANCHAAYKIHDEKMKKPTLAKGSFGNANCTAAGCHSINDPPYIYYDFHNNVVNCTSCHMDNNGSNIHPIKYLQNNGRDFAQMNITAASCKLCHKNSVGDEVLARWGVTPRKVGSQHHSDDPRNGSKWNKTIDPYWDYTPNIVTFVNGFLKNIERGFMTNFDAMNDTNASVARISENTTIDAPFGVYPDNHEFNSTIRANGWYAYGTATKLEWTTSFGDPPGALAVTSTTKLQAVDANWTASFVYNKTGEVAEATIKLDSKLAKAANINTGSLKAINVSIEDNLGNVTEIYNRSLQNTAEVDWIKGEITIPNANIPNPNTIFWKNSTLDHSYNITIRTRWTGLGGSTTPNITAAYDNVFVNISEVDYKKYNFTFYINDTPSSDRYMLVFSYQTHVEKARLYVQNGSSFQYRTDLDSGAFTKAIIPLSRQEYGTGNVTIRINDSSGPNDVDVRPDYLEIEYMFIDSYRWINNSKLYYPCEYCHAPNKHFQNALGVPYNFMGDNYVGQQINTTTNWCASCHYQGYSNAGKTYNDVIVAFQAQNLQVPPEITGHTLYGVSKSQSPDYYEHSSLGSYNDSTCWGCHKGRMAEGVTSTEFMHNVSFGTNGGRNCTLCHNESAPSTYKRVNFTSVNRSMHGKLNSGAVSSSRNATNKPCWGCHGTVNGTWANESDQPETSHNETYYNNPRKCEDCHITGSLKFTTKNVTDHIPSGSPLTDVNTSSYNFTYCSYCHNNSVGASFDPDGLGVAGGSATDASAAHYGANKSKNMLMSAASNSTDCNYCHRDGSNMAKWGILQESLSNISNKNGTASTGYNHNAYTLSSQCSSCHGGTVANFHVSAMSPGEKGNPDCKSCHNVSSPGTYSKVDFTAINISIHGSLNKQAYSSPGNVTNKPCWGCHGTVNTTSGLANESDQSQNDHNNTYKASPRKCEDCHINGSIRFTAPGLTEHIMPGKNALTQINVTEGYCTICHNNSVTPGSDSDGLGVAGGSVINASAAHYAKDASNNLMTAVYHSDNCTYCHFVNNGSSAWLTPRKPLSSTHSSYSESTQPSTCWGCHVDSRAEPSTFHVQEINKGAGSGPNCRGCHNTSDTSTDKGHIDGNIFNTSIHGSLNTTGGADLNEPCWGCHGNGNSEGHNETGDAYGKGTYRKPYNCQDCHVYGGIRNTWALARGALNVSEHYTGGNDIKASYNATTIYSCLKCHQDIGELRNPNGDSDANKTAWASGGDTYNLTIGGNNSPYHYGRKRVDMRSSMNTTCTYCHQNSSSVFPMSNANRSIYEHTDSGTKNITARTCTDAGCHASGLIHNQTLTRPAVQVWTSGKYDYCAPCHTESGISTKKVRGHNTTNITLVSMDCGYCHNVSSQGLISGGALRIHSPRLANKSTANSTCVACHRDTKYVPAGRMINTHYPGATSDKGNTSESERTCELCHGEVSTGKLHETLVKKPAYDCSSCHLGGGKTSPYNATTGRATVNAFQHDNATHAPTNQTSCERCHNNTNRQETFHFTQWANGTSVAPGWAGWMNGTQANCIDCHRNNTNQAPFYAEPGRTGHDTYTLNQCYDCHARVPTYLSDPKAMHWVDQSPANANCTLCHDIGGEASKEVDVAAMNRSDSIHVNLNKDATVVKAVAPYAAESKRCWACHGNGSEPPTHPTNYKSAFKCIDCHVPSAGRNTNYTPNSTILNVTEHYRGGSDVKTMAAAYCTDCHNKTEMLKKNNDTALSTVNPVNDSVAHSGRRRSDVRSAANTTCTYCHQNGSTAFESVMLSSLNKSVIEHTTNTSANISNAALTCTAGSCHSTGFIHNATLAKPAVQVWTAGSKDNCAPCHKPGSTNASTYVYAHNTSNISTVSMDCGYCHNASSQGAKSNNPLKIHTGLLTNASTTNTSCAACHRDSTYVGPSRVINTHYPDAPAGKANTSRSTLDCEKCHAWVSGTNMHASGLVRKPSYDCNACHNASGGSPYKANFTQFVNVTRHDNASHNTSNIINCNWCHNNSNRPEPFHFTRWSNGTAEAPGWAGWVNGTRANCTVCHVTYASQAPFYAEPASWHRAAYGSSLSDCYQCHSNLTVLNASDSRTPVEMHNVTRSIDWSNCNACHSDRYGGAPRVDNTSISAANSMHAGIDGATSGNINPACKACHGGNISIHRNSTANNCTYCHITNKLKYTTRNVSEHIPNGSYANITVNTSRYQQVFCDLCHNNSIASFSDDTPGSRNATTAHYGQNRNANRLMTSVANSTDCIFCHKNSSNMVKWGVLQTSNANISNRGDHASYSTSTVCYDCHSDSRGRPLTFHTEELNAGAGSSPNCVGCHNITGAYRKIDFSITNSTADNHRNLSSAANAAGYDAANKPCWGCHGNGSAEGHNTTGDAYGKGTYTNPYNCTECHVSGGVRNTWASSNGALTVSEHFTRGTDIKASYNATAVFSCLACHQNISEMLLPNGDPDAGTFDADKDGINGTGISAYHYGRKRTDLRSGANTSCTYCHQNSSSTFPLSYTNRSIYEHTDTGARNTTGANCTSSKCHAAGFIHNQSLRKNTTLVWTQGNKDYCAPCHRAGDANATKYVYSHNTSTTQASDDCGYCHNASSQGINGSAIKLHSTVLTNTTYPAMYGNCSGCHNGTALYVGTVKQILSHMPNASQFRGNTSMSGFACASCHNLSGKPSMHSPGMNRSNGTCDTCHFNRTSPFAATKKVIAKDDYNHSYKGQKGCSMAQCHNASNGSVFHMDRYAAGVVAEPEKFSSIWNGRNSIGFTDTPYVDCIDCHREPYNNTPPFNNTYPFNFSTNYSFNYEANHTGENRKNHLASDTLDQCYNCHTNRSIAAERYMVHNVTIEPLLGGPACVRCHNLSAPATGDFPPITRKVNHTALNQSVHRKLINYTAWNESKKPNAILLDSACWTCHATNILDLPNNAHPDRGGPASTRPFQCIECHPSGGNISNYNPQVYQNATRIYKHYAGEDFLGEIIFNSSKNCFECHRNSLLPNAGVSYGSYLFGSEANVSHYAARGGLARTNKSNYGCNECHAIGGTGGTNGTDYGNAIGVPGTHNAMGSEPIACQNSCHNSNPGFNITLHAQKLGIYIGASACYAADCHPPPPPPPEDCDPEVEECRGTG